MGAIAAQLAMQTHTFLINVGLQIVKRPFFLISAWLLVTGEAESEQVLELKQAVACGRLQLAEPYVTYCGFWEACGLTEELQVDEEHYPG